MNSFVQQGSESASLFHLFHLFIDWSELVGFWCWFVCWGCLSGVVCCFSMLLTNLVDRVV